MTISIQGSNAALTALDTLTTQTNTTTGASAPTGPLGQAGGGVSSAFDLSGLGGPAPSLTGDLTDAASLADAAVAAGGTIETILQQLRQDAASAADPNLSDGARTDLSHSFAAGLAQIQAAVQGASVGGVNLIDGSLTGPVSAAGSVTLSPTNLSLGGPLIGLGTDASLSDPQSAAALADQLSSAVDNVGQAVGQIAAQSQAINGHLALVAQAGLSLSAGSVSSDIDGETASLIALQVQQQLQSVGGPIANSSPQSILALFR